MERELKIYAKHYHQLGLNITCITNYLTENNFKFKSITKTPYHSIESLLKKRQESNEIEKLDWENATGVGLILSNFNNNISNFIALDIDGCQDENLIEEFLMTLGLEYDYEWVIKSGSQNGFHIVFGIDFFDEENELSREGFAKNIELICGTYSVKKEFENKIEKIEILGDCNLMLPPSIHLSTLKYEFINCEYPRFEPDFVTVFNFNKFLNTYLKKSIEKDSKGKIIEEKLNKSSIDFKEKSIRSHKRTMLEISNYKPIYTLIFDCETTGLPARNDISYKETDKWPRLVQVSWIVLWNSVIIKKKTELVFNESFSQINLVNLDFSKIEMIGKPIREVLNSFNKDLKEVDKIVAHNVEFDMKVIQSELFRLGLDDQFDNKDVCCTMKDSVKLFKSSVDSFKKFPTLNELHNLLLKEKFTGSHNAISDVLATTRCYRVLQEKKIKPFYDKPELNVSKYHLDFLKKYDNDY